MRDEATILRTLRALGYRPVDDAWDTDGRVTYIHGHDADISAIRILDRIMARHGWAKHPTELRAYRCNNTADLIEIEPGGADCRGHYLHHIKAAVVA